MFIRLGLYNVRNFFNKKINAADDKNKKEPILKLVETTNELTLKCSNLELNVAVLTSDLMYLMSLSLRR